MQLGKIQKVSIREVWPNEATSFTPWLETHPEELGELLGLELEFVREQSVGAFSLDLFGRDINSERLIIVENQLERSDHSHLGQLLTYAGGLEPAYVVWIASEIRDEHKAALDWLNSVTNSDTFFFGIELKAIRIGDSDPAPLLDVVVQPNAWSKQGHDTRSLATDSERNQRFQGFWKELIDSLSEEFVGLKNKTAPGQQWISTSTGVSGVSLNLVFWANGLRAEFYFGASSAELNQARFLAVMDGIDVFEAAARRELTGEALEGKKAARISSYGLPEADVKNVTDWPQYIDWFKEAYRDLRRVTGTDFVERIRAAGN